MNETERRFHVFLAGEHLAIETLDKIGRLRAPLEVEPDVERMISDSKESAVTLKAIRKAKSDTEGAELLTRLRELEATSRRAARDAGLEACLPEQTP